MKSTGRLLIAMMLFILILPSMNSEKNVITQNNDFVQRNIETRYLPVSSLGNSVLHDDFDSFPGYNQSLWNLESYGNGSVSWIEGDQFVMNASRHSFRTLTSIQTFEVGHEVLIRMKLIEEDAVVCVGWTNHTPITEYNYLFSNSSVLFQGAHSTVLLEKVSTDTGQRTSKMLSGIDSSVFHDYRMVWNSTVLIAYIDDIRMAVIGDTMPSGPLHFKIAITENRDIITEGSVIIDSITIREHHSMITESPPFISLDSPGNNTRNLAGDPIDITAVGHNGTIFWSWDGATNISGDEHCDIRLPASAGEHTLDVYCLDGYGYEIWTSARFVFNTMGEPPALVAKKMSKPPTIDGIILSNEWPITTLHSLDLVRMDGIYFSVDVMIGSDDKFIYLAIDSPIKTGHDSRAALIVDGSFDGVYNGNNETPTMSIWYNKGSPDAWEGYDELQAMVSSDDGHITFFRLATIPIGFMSASSVTPYGVHYEFRLPLSEFNAQPGSSLGISIMLYPSGMGVHNLFYPLLFPWENASRLAALIIPVSISPIITTIGLSLSFGIIALVSYFGWKRKVAGSSTIAIESEESMRILELIQSYDEITLERLAVMVQQSETEIRETLRELRESNIIDVEINDDGTIRRKL
ncbi:hypothetical protein EU527_12265 [Candidatus Thorarchaeota archaeon]|nr:MAG: hypothetical protein EU527_12265 [Candidatus Thorarchaeota archaeon]